MLLRSGTDWHLDPVGRATITRYLETTGSSRSAADPLTLDTYLGYTSWFMAQKGLAPLDLRITHLNRSRHQPGFTARPDAGHAITARHVVLALGFANFAAVPRETAELIPAGRSHHTSECVDLAASRVAGV